MTDSRARNTSCQKLTRGGPDRMMRKPSPPPKNAREPRKSAATRRVRLPVATELPEAAAPVADQPPPEQLAPSIWIAIDPGIPGGYLAGRYDLTIRGRAISAVPVSHVSLRADEWVTSASAYGQPDRAALCELPDGTPGASGCSASTCHAPHGPGPEQCQFDITARREDGTEHTQTFELEIDPAAEAPVSVVSGPTDPRASSVPPHALLFIERATIDVSYNLTVQGWAVSFGPIQSVRVLVDDAFVGEAVYGGERQDIAGAFPIYPGALLSGFGLTIPLGESHRDATTIRVRMIGLNGFSHEESIRPEHGAPTVMFPTPKPFALVDRPASYHLVSPDQPRDDPFAGLVLPPETAAALQGRAPPAAAPIEMYCDEAELTGDGMLSLNGWAVCASGIAQVRVLLDGKDVGLATFGHERLDVASIHPDIRMARLSGFRFAQPVGMRFKGEHEVRVIVCGAQGGEAGQLTSVTATAASRCPISTMPTCRTLPPNRPRNSASSSTPRSWPTARCWSRSSGRMTIEGWLLTRSGVADFQVFLDDQLLGEAHCGLVRQDVGAAFPDWPNAVRSGFAFHCPPRSLRDGDHTVRLIIRANNGIEMTRSFRIVVKKSDDRDDAVAIRRRIPRVETDMMLAVLAGMNPRPAFRVIIRQGPAGRPRRLAHDARCAAPSGLWRLDGDGAGCRRRHRRRGRRR